MVKLKLPKLTMKDKIAVLILVIFLVVVTMPVYSPRDECEVARPGYECASAHDVMIEECEYWGEYDCDTSADVSLLQVEWYIENLCEIAKKGEALDCSNLKLACNQVTGKQVCP